MPISNGMVNQIVIYSHNEILYSARRKQTINTLNNVDESNNLRLGRKQKLTQYDSFTQNLKIRAKTNLYGIRNTYNYGKNMKYRSDNWKRLMVTSKRTLI